MLARGRAVSGLQIGDRQLERACEHRIGSRQRNLFAWPLVPARVGLHRILRARQNAWDAILIKIPGKCGPASVLCFLRMTRKIRNAPMAVSLFYSRKIVKILSNPITNSHKYKKNKIRPKNSQKCFASAIIKHKIQTPLDTRICHFE